MKKKTSGRGSSKYIIPGILAIVLVVAIFLGAKFMPKQNLASIYNIDEAGTNFDNIQIGDEINYEVNGYSDWQVIGKDDYEGTIDVVSKSDTEDLTLEPNQTKEYYENKFQETANKYTDENYVINARTVKQSDLDYFNYNNEFWLDNISDTNITTSQNTYQYTGVKNYKIYLIPYVNLTVGDVEIFNNGDIIEYPINGVDRWIIVKSNGDWGTGDITIIPEMPIELIIDNSNDDINAKADAIFSLFNNNNNQWSQFENFLAFGQCNYYINSSYYSEETLMSALANFFGQQTEKIWLLRSNCYYSEKETIISGGCGGIGYYENDILSTYTSRTVIYSNTSKTLGYRPVIKLKIRREIKDKDKKEISSKLQVGDNVKYEAKGYKDWKVLSIDKDNNTVDIISGGIVKNLTLSGKEDWDNFEDIIQREVDEYKNGPNAKKATTITSSYLKTLKRIDKSILSTYWTFSKSSHVDYSYTFDDGKVDFVYYNIGTIKLYKSDNFEMYLNNVTLYVNYVGDSEQVNQYNNNFFGAFINGVYITGSNSVSYTAGLRPVITLKLDDVEKLPDKEAEKIEQETEKQERIYIKEQESKNKDYKGPSKVDDSTSSTGDKTITPSEDSKNKPGKVEKIVYKDKPSTRYQLIIQYIIIAIQLGVIIYLLLKRKK